MTEIAPDRRTVIGPYYVDLWEGFFRDEISVWRDVRPALGGRIARKVVRKKDSAAYYDEVVAYVTKGWLEIQAAVE